MTSLSLLDRVRGSDQEAWQRLLYLYAPMVQYWCRSWGLQGADADDLQQEVFLTINRKLESFRKERPGDTFRGWLRVVTQRKFLDFCRLRKRRQDLHTGGHEQLQHLPDVTDLPVAEDPPEEVQRLHQRALELVRSEFEERTWLAFWRSAVERHSPADVAQEMGMTAAGVRKAKSRVLRRLREELGEVLE